MTGATRKATFVLVLMLLTFPMVAGGTNEPETSPVADDATEGAEPAGVSEIDPIVLDTATAEVLFDLGVMPFQNRIPAENFVLTTLLGDDTALVDYRGKVVFLNFWATWCPPCREEMPSMQVLYDALADEGLEILAVNVMEPRDTVSAFIEENGFTYPVLLDTIGRIARRYSVRAYPTSYIIDREGNVVAVRPGYHDWGTTEMIEGFRRFLSL